MIIIDPPIWPYASAVDLREFLDRLNDIQLERDPNLDANDREMIVELRAEAEHYLRAREEQGPDAGLEWVDERRFWSAEKLRRELVKLDDLEARVRSGATPVWPGMTRDQELEMLADSRQAMEHWLDVGEAAGGGLCSPEAGQVQRETTVSGRP